MIHTFIGDWRSGDRARRRLRGVCGGEPSGSAGLSLEELERGSRTAAAAGFAFHEVDAQTIWFREQALQYVPIMRGVIRHEAGEPTVRVIGLVNWYVVTLVAALIVGMGRSIVIVLPYLFGGLGILYFIQAVRFWRVATQLR